MSSEADTPDDPKASARPRELFSVYASVSGKAETFEDPRAAGRAFFLADPEERPTVTHLIGNSARTMARTEIHGVHPSGEPQYFKSLPSSHAPDAAFREGFLEAMEASLTERIGQIGAVKEAAAPARVAARLQDDLESFAYRVPGKAAQVWIGHSLEHPSGPVLKVAVDAYVAGLDRDAAVGRAADAQVSPFDVRTSEVPRDAVGSKVTRHEKDWER